MGLLEQLWDDTVAGPRPDSGLSRLRKYPSLSPAASDPMITRSITMLRSKSSNHRNLTVDTGSGSEPSSPSCDSPLTPGTPRGNWRRKPAAAAAFQETAEPRSPTVYDWFISYFSSPSVHVISVFRSEPSMIELVSDSIKGTGTVCRSIDSSASRRGLMCLFDGWI